jgi:solute:Na+ symporter, SSS family
MSTISSGMNSSATVFLKDIYQRYIDSNVTPRREMMVLYVSTAAMGIFAIVAGIAMIGVKSILDLWWQLAGIFSGGMLGLFLLGMLSRTAGNFEAKLATVIGIIVILWMSLSALLPHQFAVIRNPLHLNMVIVVGTLSIFLVGSVTARLRRRG